MREILFRGKRCDNSEWVEGDLHQYNHQYDYIIDKFDFRYSVNHLTVGQYTGMTDKNGRKIFEGDIVECWSEGVKAKGNVQQRNDGLWIIYPAWQKLIMWGLCPDEYGNTTVEIIGNIHDNTKE